MSSSAVTLEDIEAARREELACAPAPMPNAAPDQNQEVWDISDLLSRRPQPIDWLIDDIWPAGVHSDLFAPPECGKSTLAWSQIISIATGRSWFGKRVKQGRVLVVGGEFTNSEWAARSIRRFLGDHPFPVDLIKIMPITSPIFKLNRDGEWQMTASGASVDDLISRFRPALVVIDTAAMLGMVDGTNYAQSYDLAIKFQQLMDEHNTTGLTISHTNQASQHKDEQLSWRLNYLSRSGGNGYPGRLRIMHGASRLRETDHLSELLGLSDRIKEGCKFVCYGVSKCSEIATPTWHFTSPAIFEMKKDGSLVLVKDGAEVRDVICSNKPVVKDSTTNIGDKKNVKDW